LAVSIPFALLSEWFIEKLIIRIGENSLDSRTINNVTSARISVPPLIKSTASSVTAEGDEKYEWTVDLSKTEPYWKGENFFIPFLDLSYTD
jgi:hypothetical protein